VSRLALKCHPMVPHFCATDFPIVKCPLPKTPCHMTTASRERPLKYRGLCQSVSNRIFSTSLTSSPSDSFSPASIAPSDHRAVTFVSCGGRPVRPLAAAAFPTVMLSEITFSRWVHNSLLVCNLRGGSSCAGVPFSYRTLGCGPVSPFWAPLCLLLLPRRWIEAQCYRHLDIGSSLQLTSLHP